MFLRLSARLIALKLGLFLIGSLFLNNDKANEEAHYVVSAIPGYKMTHWNLLIVSI